MAPGAGLSPDVVEEVRAILRAIKQLERVVRLKRKYSRYPVSREVAGFRSQTTPRLRRETRRYIGTIYEGTSNMQLQTIAKELLK